MVPKQSGEIASLRSQQGLPRLRLAMTGKKRLAMTGKKRLAMTPPFVIARHSGAEAIPVAY